MIKTNSTIAIALCISLGISAVIADELRPFQILAGGAKDKSVSLTMASGDTYSDVVVETVDKLASGEISWIKISYSDVGHPSSRDGFRFKGSAWIQARQICSIRIRERPKPDMQDGDEESVDIDADERAPAESTSDPA